MSVVLPIIKSPTSQIKGCQENKCQETILKGFSLVWSSDQRTADDKSKSVNDNSNSEQFVDQVDFKQQEHKELAGIKIKIINTRFVIARDEINDVNETESTVQYNQFVQESLGHLLHIVFISSFTFSSKLMQ